MESGYKEYGLGVEPRRELLEGVHAVILFETSLGLLVWWGSLVQM